MTVASIKRLVNEAVRQYPELGGPVAGNVTEMEFVRVAKAKGGKLFRSGWPDYLLQLRGRTIGVEVKSNTDTIRPAQVRMFTLLCSVGIKVYIWSPEKPNHLTRWDKWVSPTEKRRRAAAAAPPGKGVGYITRTRTRYNTP
jgi:hypothetical protein